MEMAIIRLFDLPNGAGINSKVVYLAPTKALCSERFHDWHKKFHSLGIVCSELTGDTEFGKTSGIQSSNIIVTTPEKWDSMTRKWRDYKTFMNYLSLLLVIFLTNDIKRIKFVD